MQKAGFLMTRLIWHYHKQIELCYEKNLLFAYAKTDVQISYTVTVQVISTFIFYYRQYNPSTF